MRHRRNSLALVLPSLLLFQSALLFSQSRETVRPSIRITRAIDDETRIVRGGNRHPLTRPELESGRPSPDRRMERMILTLSSDPAQQKAMEQLIADQHNPHSPRYHQWLTPESFGREFGISNEDLEQVENWMRSHGLTVEEVSAGRRSILFSGTVAQVESAFHTSIRSYYVDGKTHYANAADPEIPSAMASVVRGPVSLHDFQSKPAHGPARPIARPQFSAGGGSYYMGPADFATIYDAGPLYQNSIDGTGQTIAIVGRCNIHLSDVQMFRSYFGLPVNNPKVIVNGSDPGIVSADEQGEADLDVEWSGAVAKNATIDYVVSASTNSSDGVNLSAQYIVNHNLAPVMSVSFGLCEAAAGSSGNAFINNLWQQAVLQGITVLVSSGDSGAAGCDGATAGTGTLGRGVNALCSTPYSVCVGGTQFNDKTNAGLYWSSTSDPNTKSSALQYIPETTWNESGLAVGGSGLWSSGGGASTVYAKPSWQNVSGVPADGMRDVPDVSLTAAGHDGYLVFINGQLFAQSGTSAAAPSFAGLMSLVVQSTGAAQGNANPTLYTLAANQQSGGAAVFHDVATGSNTVPGVTGFNAGPGYDQATGLGSVDASMLVNHWNDGSSTSATLNLNLQTAAISVVPGASAVLIVAVGPSGNFNSAVTLAVSGLPSGLTASFSPTGFNAPGAGVSTLTFSASSQTAPGNYTVQVTAAGGGITQNAALVVKVNAPASFTVAFNAASVSVRPGSSATAKATIKSTSGFRSTVALSATGIPAGMTAKFSPANVAVLGSGSSTLTLSTTSRATPGSYSIQITATGGGLTQNSTLMVLVPSLTLASDVQSVTIAQGHSAAVHLTTSGIGGFNAAVTFSSSGRPSGMAASFSPTSLAAPGSGTSVLTLSAGSTTAAGSYNIRISALGGGLTTTLVLPVTVTRTTALVLTGSPGSVAVQQGSATGVNVNVGTVGDLANDVTLGVSGLPAGVTGSFSAATLPAPGSGTSTLTLSASPTAPTGTYMATISATGEGITKTIPLPVTVAGFTLKASKTVASILAGTGLNIDVNVDETGGYNSALALSVSGLPAGITATFTPASVSGAGSHSCTLKLSRALSAILGTSALTISATDGNITHTAKLTLTVN